MSLTPNKQDDLIQALQNPDLYVHPVIDFTVIETHISWVILTGVFAYKIKKPVNFGFVDFSSLDKRLYFCQQELELNRHFAPEIYLEVLAIKGNRQQPKFDSKDRVIEYAVKMKEFSQQQLLSHLASEQNLEPHHIDSMADIVADFHSNSKLADPDSIFGEEKTILKWSQENIDQIESALPPNLLSGLFEAIKTQSLTLKKAFTNILKLRKKDGFIRLCHGDLHLGNMALINDRVTAFDCIEFNEELHWIDTISDVAFVVMDLQARGYRKFSWRFINRYLQSSGDYAGISVLSYYFIYRALVRAKVEALSVDPNKMDIDDKKKLYQNSLNYLKLAESWSTPTSPSIILMHGLSGSGKSTVAFQLVEALGAIQIRSDVERKRLHGFSANENSRSEIQQGIYNIDATAKTYERLYKLAKTIIQAGHQVIVDATFLKQSQRDRFRHLAQKENTAFIIISCEASINTLSERIRQRSKIDSEPSEATSEVLLNQLKFQDDLSHSEQKNTITVSNSGNDLNPKQLEEIKLRLVHQYID